MELLVQRVDLHLLDIESITNILHGSQCQTPELCVSSWVCCCGCPSSRVVTQTTSS